MKICLDAGHYKGYNQGVVKSYYEGNVMWKVTNLQKKYLEQYKDVTVVLTRSDVAKDLSLSNRGAKAKGCDLFISNHSNSCGTESVDRPVIIYAYDNKNKADIFGKKLGQALQDVMSTKQKYQMMQRKNDSGGEYYGVMRSARANGCPLYYIVEHGFHSNKATCNWLLKDENLEKMVKAEVEVIAKHFNLEKKSQTTQNNSTYTVDTDVLNVRSGRGTEYSIVGTVKRGQKINIWSIAKDSKGRNWGSFRYSFEPDIVGYVCMDYLK